MTSNGASHKVNFHKLGKYLPANIPASKLSNFLRSNLLFHLRISPCSVDETVSLIPLLVTTIEYAISNQAGSSSIQDTLIVIFECITRLIKSDFAVMNPAILEHLVVTTLAKIVPLKKKIHRSVYIWIGNILGWCFHSVHNMPLEIVRHFQRGVAPTKYRRPLACFQTIATFIANPTVFMSFYYTYHAFSSQLTPPCFDAVLQHIGSFLPRDMHQYHAYRRTLMQKQSTVEVKMTTPEPFHDTYVVKNFTSIKLWDVVMALAEQFPHKAKHLLTVHEKITLTYLVQVPAYDGVVADVLYDKLLRYIVLRGVHAGTTLQTLSWEQWIKGVPALWATKRARNMLLALSTVFNLTRFIPGSALMSEDLTTRQFIHSWVLDILPEVVESDFPEVQGMYLKIIAFNPELQYSVLPKLCQLHADLEQFIDLLPEEEMHNVVFTIPPSRKFKIVGGKDTFSTKQSTWWQVIDETYTMQKLNSIDEIPKSSSSSLVSLVVSTTSSKKSKMGKMWDFLLTSTTTAVTGNSSEESSQSSSTLVESAGKGSETNEQDVSAPELKYVMADTGVKFLYKIVSGQATKETSVPNLSDSMEMLFIPEDMEIKPSAVTLPSNRLKLMQMLTYYNKVGRLFMLFNETCQESSYYQQYLSSGDVMGVMVELPEPVQKV